MKLRVPKSSLSFLLAVILPSCGSTDSGAPDSQPDAGSGGADAGSDAVAGTGKGCVPGSKRCSGDGPQLCDESAKWQTDTSCQFACQSGECIGLCKPGSKQCAGNQRQKCDSSGAWQSGDVCEHACHNGDCVGSCAPGEKGCQGRKVLSCGANGEWQSGNDCEHSCYGGECYGECVPGETRCQETLAQGCDSHGVWQTTSCCKYLCQNAACVGECVPGAKRCNGFVPSACDSNGQWQSGEGCKSQACNAGNCVGVCTPNTRRCDGNKPQSCDADGNWQNQPACSAPTLTCGDGKCLSTCGTGLFDPLLEDCWNGQFRVAKLVSVKGGYGIDATEVTRSQYTSWLASSPSLSGQPTSCDWNASFDPDGACESGAGVCKTDCGAHPQVCVDWCDAYAYCKAVGKRLCGKVGGGANVATDGADASLSQWYNACSSGGLHDFPYGSAFEAFRCNGAELGLGTTLQAAILPGCQSSEAGYVGVLDLCGNVVEWEDSCYQTVGKDDSCWARGSAFDCTSYYSCEPHMAPARGSPFPMVGFRCCSDP